MAGRTLPLPLPAKGLGRGLVGRPRGQAVNEWALFGTPAMRELMRVSGVDTLLAAIGDGAIEAEIRFGASSDRTPMKNAVIGLAHARQAKSAGFLEQARRAAAEEAGKDPGKRGLRVVPTRNPYYIRREERSAMNERMRQGLRQAVLERNPARFREGFFAAVSMVRDFYVSHFVGERLLREASQFTGVTPLSPAYAKQKRAAVGFEHPILTRTGQLRDCLIVVQTKGARNG